ncbi:ATP-binding protein [Nocardioides zeae]|uniref:Sensor-like histidine kinase SenX3 n=1 Tax=Nocardioides imazamoxiresistens TaxID=3231893 RepID=A0ABU3PTP8_9ACTN|nr:ATP-binding protein [Nocardioides zeae]MDT9592559.1 ATP-binding protein [Nocardioides zeae]
MSSPVAGSGRLAPTSAREPVPLRHLTWPWALAWAAVVAGVTALGRLTAEGAGQPSLVSPSIGLAVLWFLSRGAGARSFDVLLLVAVLVAVSVASAMPVGVAVALVLGALVQVGATVGLLRRWCRPVWGVADGAAPIDSADRLLRVLGATGVGAVLGGLAGVVGLLVEGATPDPLDAAVLVGRAVAGGLLVVPPALVVGRALAVRRTSRPADEGGLLEAVALAAVTVAVYVAAFLQSDVPLAFPLLLVTGWAALRFSTAFATVHGVVLGLVVVLFTLDGTGPFALAEDHRVGLVVAQLFVSVVLVSGLLLGVGRDERRSALLEARGARASASEQAALLRTIIDTMHEGLVVVEEGGRVLLGNPAARGMAWGAERTYQVRDADGRLLGEEDFPSRRALAGEEVHGRYAVRTAAGDELLVEITAIPMPTADGAPARSVTVFRDVTEAEQQRLELVAFAGVVAHDLKNPLTAVDGWVELLADGLEDGASPDRALVVQAVERVQSASSRMRSLIRHLLQHATSRDAPLRAEDTDVAAIARDVARGRDAADRVEVGEMPCLHVDPAMIRQLLENLVGNALKYVDPGAAAHVVVDGVGAGTDPQVPEGMVALRVTDNGVGIPDESKDLVFQQFYRAHATAYSGTGLGLAICRRIVDRHGGTITVLDNPAGRGTRIEVLLPAATGRSDRSDRAGQAGQASPA